MIASHYRALGPASPREKLVLADFVLLALLWISRDPKFVPGWGTLFAPGYVTDGTTGAFMAILLFLLPADPLAVCCHCFSGSRGLGATAAGGEKSSGGVRCRADGGLCSSAGRGPPVRLLSLASDPASERTTMREMNLGAVDALGAVDSESCASNIQAVQVEMGTLGGRTDQPPSASLHHGSGSDEGSEPSPMLQRMPASASPMLHPSAPGSSAERPEPSEPRDAHSSASGGGSVGDGGRLVSPPRWAAGSAPGSSSSQSQSREKLMYAPLLEWGQVQAILPWSVILLLAGGLALADACLRSGLSAEVGRSLDAMAGLSPGLVTLLLCVIVSAVTTVTSNVATSSIFLPVVSGLAQSMGVHPLSLMIPVALTCSLAFVLPVSTPPNAMAFASGRLAVSDMIQIGVVMNVLGVLIVLIANATLGSAIFGMGVVGDEWRLQAAPAAPPPP